MELKSHSFYRIAYNKFNIRLLESIESFHKLLYFFCNAKILYNSSKHILNGCFFMFSLLENHRMIRDIQLRLYENIDVRVTSCMEKCYYFYYFYPSFSSVKKDAHDCGNSIDVRWN